jgi:hypothetical protein
VAVIERGSVAATLWPGFPETVDARGQALQMIAAARVLLAS